MRWPIARLSQVAEVNPRDRDWRDWDPGTEVSFVPMAAVSELTAAIEDKQVRRLEDVRKGFTAFREGDLLIAKITPCMENGKAAIATPLVNGRGFGSTEFHVIRPKTGLDVRFLYHFVRQQTFRTAARARMRGAAGQQRVPEEFIREYPLPVPPPSEQRRIVEILDQADRLRRLRAEADARAIRVLPALFVKMFGDPAYNPYGWPVRTLGSLLLEMPRNGISPSSGGRVPGRVLSLSAITGAAYAPDATKSGWFAGRPGADKYVDQRDFLVCRGNGNLQLVGRGRFPVSTNPDTVFPDTIIAVRVDLDQIDRSYIEALWVTPYLRSKIEGGARTTSGIHKINQKFLASLEIPVPPIGLQRRFAQVANTLPAAVRTDSAVCLNRLFGVLLRLAFIAQLTRRWRKTHMKDLLQETEQQARDLEEVAR